MFDPRRRRQAGRIQGFCVRNGGSNASKNSGGRGQGGAALLLLLFLGITGCSGERPTNLGLRQGQLAPCPKTPNCVSSFATDAEHSIAPLLFSAPPPEVMRRVRQALDQMERVTIVREEPLYLHAEFTSLIFRFVDDVEIYLDAPTGSLHFRSASRLGQSDLGVNRERVETIKHLLAQTHATSSP